MCGEHARYHGQVRVVIRPYAQPWHAASSLMVESAVAVAHLAPSDRTLEDARTNAFWLYSIMLMTEQGRWDDEHAQNKTMNDVRAELATLASSVLGDDGRKNSSVPLVSLSNGETVAEAVRARTRVGSSNNGSRVTQDLKYCVRTCTLLTRSGKDRSSKFDPCDTHGAVERRG